MEWTRRRLVGVTAAATLAGCLGDDGNGDDDGSDVPDDAASALESADVVDRTGQDRVEVTVDPEGDGFEPEVIEIDADTFIEWSWEGSSVGLYPLDIPPECVWDEEDNEDDEWTAGDEFDRLFWAPGEYLYASRTDDEGEEFTGAFRVLETDETDAEGHGGDDGEDDDDGGGMGMDLADPGR